MPSCDVGVGYRLQELGLMGSLEVNSDEGGCVTEARDVGRPATGAWAAA